MILKNLEDMMSSYFHQDYDLNGPDDESILVKYARHHQAEQVRQVVQDIDQLLASPLDGLLARFEQATGNDNMMIGETDSEAKQWLEAARLTLTRTVS